MRVAAIDCGTNTIRLLITETPVTLVEAENGTLAEEELSGSPLGSVSKPSLQEVTRLVEFVGLGQGVDATHRFADDAIQRAFAVIERYAGVISENDVQRVRFVATSATRDAENREVFLSGVRDRLGVEPEVITGDEEAKLSFTGVLSGVPVSAEPVLVMDSGGGSTELVRGLADGTILQSISLDMGSRRVKERCLQTDPPTDREIMNGRVEVRRLLHNSGIDLESVRTFIGVAGTVTTLSALAQRLPDYDRKLVHGSTIDLDTLGELTERLLSMTADQIAALPSVLAARAPYLGAGALVIYEVAQTVGSSTLVVSESDILDGIALSLLS
jgi:exopolyphosphatase/guanosine-5'-triphosphate,3'-diphosphate pyrophosphatase